MNTTYSVIDSQNIVSFLAMATGFHATIYLCTDVDD